VGGLGYSLFWMWAGFRAPGLGGTAAAKESLKWLAMPTSGAFVLATAAVLVLVVVNVLPSRRNVQG
jgi:multisubunit Na+/H+ antiporter MnhB subunit